MTAVELPVRHLVTGTLELGTILRLHRSIRSTLSRLPWETKNRGVPTLTRIRQGHTLFG